MNDSQEQSVADVKRHVRQHLIIAAGLMVGTVLTVWASKIDMGGHAVNIAVAVTIASVQAFLIAGFFMHLLSEKKMVYSILIFTAIFFTVLMGMTVWAHLPENVIHYK